MPAATFQQDTHQKIIAYRLACGRIRNEESEKKSERKRRNEERKKKSIK